MSSLALPPPLCSACKRRAAGGPGPPSQRHLRNQAGTWGKPAMTASRCCAALRPFISARDTSTMPLKVSGPSVQLQAEDGQGAPVGKRRGMAVPTTQHRPARPPAAALRAGDVAVGHAAERNHGEVCGAVLILDRSGLLAAAACRRRRHSALAPRLCAPWASALAAGCTARPLPGHKRPAVANGGGRGRSSGACLRGAHD